MATSCFNNLIVMAEIPSFLKRGLIAKMATGCAYFAINPLLKKLGISAMTIGLLKNDVAIVAINPLD